MSEIETNEVVINGVSVSSIVDYAKRRHLTVPFVTNTLIKGDDQNAKIEPKFKIGSTGMYSIDELDAAYLTRGSKGITLASMGYLHPAKKAELESRILEQAEEKAELALHLEEARKEIGQLIENLQESETELEDVKAQLIRAELNLDAGKTQYAKLLTQCNELRADNSGLKDLLRATLQDALRAYSELEWANNFQARLDEL